ncbi:MAG: BamA/TamA family outer membrane protein [Gemmatimonadetes bacterium]|nr:BamA/TamA family outer membrane protein [Gemmatimonadota bacterium]
MRRRSPRSFPMRRFPVACVLLAVGTACAGAAPLSAQTRPAGRQEVSSVRFQGNHAYPADSLARAIVTRQTECRSIVLEPFCWLGWDFALRRAYLYPDEFALDGTRLRIWYQWRGFRDARIDTTTVVRPDSTVRITFQVTEGRPVLVDSIGFQGVEDFRGTSLLKNLPLERGDRFSTIATDATRDTLVWRLANTGYAHAVVLVNSFIPSTDPYHARVTFDVVAGARAHYGPVTVEGNRNLSESTVLHTVQFRTGDLYRASQLQRAQARLFGLQIVRSANVTPDLQAVPDSVVPVNVSIQEGNLHQVRAGAGWSTAECMDVDARWVHRDFLGGGRRLQVRGRVSNILAKNFRDLLCPQSGSGVFGDLTWLASLDFSQPWIFSTRNAFQASLSAERQSLPNVYVRRAIGLSFSLTRALGPRTPLTISYRPELSRLDGAEALICTNFLVCTPEDISVLQGANWLAPIGIDLTRSTANSVLNPSHGYTFSVDLEHAARYTGSNFVYDRVVGEATRYEPVTDRVVLAGRVRAGWVGAGAFGKLLGEAPGGVDIVHPQKRLYAGGANSVRGFAQSTLGPRVLTTDVATLLAPISNKGAGCTPQEVMDKTCNANPLADGAFVARPIGGTRVIEGNLELRFPLSSTVQGAVFGDFGQVWAEHDPIALKDIQITPGVGIRYLSAIGPLRVDLAYRFQGPQELSVVTTQIQPYDPATDKPGSRLQVNGNTIDYVKTGDLVVMTRPVLFGNTARWSLSRFQLHLSIGQAF